MFRQKNGIKFFTELGEKMDYNNVTLIGNLVDTPTLNTYGQTTVAKFTIATNDKKEEVSYIDCVAFAKRAEVIAKYLSKGSSVFLSGRLKQERWKAKDETNRSKHVIIINEFRFLDGKPNETSNTGSPADDSDF